MSTPGPTHFADNAAVLAALTGLVLKEGVALGGLPAAQQAAALGLAWSTVPAGAALREADVNVALKQALSSSCRFLAVDHVELRRWLVDAGWLRRDGFGREYRRVAASELPIASATIAAALMGIDDPVQWVHDVRERDAAAREVRRRAWQERQERQAGEKGTA